MNFLAGSDGHCDSVVAELELVLGKSVSVESQTQQSLALEVKKDFFCSDGLKMNCELSIEFLRGCGLKPDQQRVADILNSCETSFRLFLCEE